MGLIEDMIERRCMRIHPGEILLKEFMEPRGLSVEVLAEMADMSPLYFEHLIGGYSDITEQDAWRLGRLFGTGMGFWLNLQKHYDQSRCQ
jgi:addiction module HigA family antidote